MITEFYLMCDDLRALTQRLKAERIACSPVHEEPWGSLIEATLPGGGKLGIYQPKHERPPVGLITTRAAAGP